MGLFDIIRQKFQGREMDDPFLGRLRYDKGFWTGRRHFAPLGAEVGFVLVAAESGPDECHRKFYQEVETKYSTLAGNIAPLLLEEMKCFEELLRLKKKRLELPRAAQVWEAFQLDSFQINCPTEDPPEWHMVYTFRPTGDTFLVTMGDWTPADVHINTEELSALELLKDSCDPLPPSLGQRPSSDSGSPRGRISSVNRRDETAQGLTPGAISPCLARRPFHWRKWLYSLLAVLGAMAVVGGVVGIWWFWDVYDPKIEGYCCLSFLTGCGLLVASSILCFGIHSSQDVLDKILAGEDLLAHWTLSRDEWKRFKTQKRLRVWKWHLLFILLVFALFCGIALFILIASGSSDEFRKALQTGLNAAVWVSGIVFIVFWCLQPRPGPAGEVFIGKEGACVGDVDWCVWSDVEGVAFLHGDRSVLQIRFFHCGGRYGHHGKIQIPVPRGKEMEIKERVHAALLE